MTDKNSIKKTKKAKKFDFLTLLIVVAIVAVSILSVNCYIEKYEKTYQAQKLQSELSVVQNEGELLSVEYLRRANYKDTKEYVSANMSMKKLENYQIEYLKDDTADRMEVVKQEDTNESFVSKITKAFSVILEYFN